jgi:hypothetical protein
MNEKLKKKYKIVENPITPDTLNGPDILLRNENRLYSIYYLTKTNIDELEKIFASLAETKLNYPAKLLSFLVVSDLSDDLFKNLSGKFDKIVSINDLNLDSIFNETKSEDDIKTIKLTQSVYFENKIKTYQKNLDYIKSVSEWESKFKVIYNKYEKATYHNWIDTNKDRKTRANIYEVYSNIFLGQKSINNKTSDLKDISPYYKFALLNDFIIENKKIEFKNITKKIFITDKEPSVNVDPFKPMRILSSVGWLISNQADEDDFESIIKSEL